MSPERRKPQGPCPHLHPHFQTRDIMSSAALAARRAVASPSTQCSASTQTLKHRVIATRRARDSRRASSASASASESAQLLRGRTVANKLADTSLFLIGIMGSGKSTVGASLAKALGYNHLDTDELIKSVTKKTPSELFAEAGESEFRAIESMILAEVAAYKRCVISTGGGIVCEKTNWMHLHNGVTVRLHGDSELLARRVLADGVEKRPLLSGDTSGEEQPTIDSIVAKINALLETRETEVTFDDGWIDERCDDRLCDRRMCARHGSTERAFERCVRRKENFRAFACACGRDVRRRVGKRRTRAHVLGLLRAAARARGRRR